MFTRRQALTTAFAATAMFAAGATPALAQGGDDPIPGIDIIIKRDPASQPIKPFSVGAREMKQFNSLKGDDRAEYLIKVVADRIEGDEGFVKAGTPALRRQMCSKCEIGPDMQVEFRAGETAYALYLKFDGIKGE